jgi:hypothetical protein
VSAAGFLSIIFAVFWGGMTASATKFRPFDSATAAAAIFPFCRDPQHPEDSHWKALVRFFLGLVILDFLPIAYLAWLVTSYGNRCGVFAIADSTMRRRVIGHQCSAASC